ncbi:MAG: hypothetical protein HKN12_10760, partial [Gemmatimonadetes bacterium]|nr:hypothetical protein [Gemmatimonadota bacterium]
MRRSIVLAITVSAALVSAACAFLHARGGPADTYWTIDNGGKALVVENLREDAGRTWIRYPGAVIDPEFRWFPLPLGGSEPYGVVRDGQVQSQYASAFTWASLPGARLAGFVGLGILPALGAGLAVLFTGLLAAARAGGRAGMIAALMTALASPLLFYGSVFWEHTLVMALAAAAFWLLRTERPAGAGLAVAAAGLFREELFLLAAAVGVALLLAGRWREVVRYSAGTLAGGSVVLAFQRATTGSWTGVHLAVNRPVPFAQAGEALSGLLFSGGPEVAVWRGLAGLALLAAARWWPGAPPTDGETAAGEAPGGSGIAPGLRVTGLRIAGLLVLAAVSVHAWIRFPSGEDAALALIHANSAAIFVPWAIAAFLLPPRKGAAPLDLLSLSALLYVALFCILVPQRSITGVHPGPRMLLPVLPVAAALAAERFPRGRVAAGAFLVLILAAGVWGARAGQLLREKRAHSGAIIAALREDPRRVVATDQFWLPTELSALWDEKQFHLITGPEDLNGLAAAVAASGETELLLVTAPGSSPDAPVRTVRNARFASFSVDFHAVPL